MSVFFLSLAKALASFAVAAAVGLAVAALLVWGIDEEERQVIRGDKHPASTILPVVNYDSQDQR